MQILEPLSTDLQLLILRSAPSTRSLLLGLPPPLHPTALRARHPSTDGSASLTLPPMQFTPVRYTLPAAPAAPAHAEARPHPLQLWAAATHACAQLTHLTRLHSQGPSAAGVRGSATLAAELVRGVGDLRGLTRLRSLALPQLTLGAVGSQPLAEALAGMGELTALDLSETGADMHALAPGLADLSELQTLNLSRVSLTGGQAHALACHIPCLTALTCIDLSHATLRNRDWLALCEPLGALRALRVLRLEHNQLAARDLRPDSSAMHVWHALEVLSLQGNWLLAGAAEHFVRSCRTARTLDLSSTGLTAPGLRQIALRLCSLTQLQELRLAGNGLGADGIAELAACFDALCGLTALDVSSTDIDDAGAFVLGMLLPSLRNLQVRRPVPARLWTSICFASA